MMNNNESRPLTSKTKKGSNKKPKVETFYHTESGSFSYVVSDFASRVCAIIDPVLDFDYASGTVGFSSAKEIIQYVRCHELSVEYLIETHVHADHLSASPYLQQELGGKMMVSKQIIMVQENFGKLFNEGTEFQRDGRQFDVLLDDLDTYQIGTLTAQVISTPGHTPACMTHLIGDVAFVGDTLFMPDSGTARADFPGGDAGCLYKSIKRILSLPPETKLYLCHDYQSDNEQLRCMSYVREQLEHNIHVNADVSMDEFVVMRESKDTSLSYPRLIFPALQVNMRAGHFPPADNNGEVYLKVPVSGMNTSDISVP